MNPDLPPELSAFVQLVDGQPEPVQTVFRYCLAIALVETGKAHLIQTTPSENGIIYTFETTRGDVFSLTKPSLSEEIETEMMEHLREILRAEGWL